MRPPAAFPVSRDALSVSRRLLHDSRALLAEAQGVLQDARHLLARQRYRKIVCAWCERTIRWQRCDTAVPWSVSHSICYDCFAGVLQELAPPSGSGAGIPLLPCLP
jgi:hypothetical protein